MAGSSWKTTWTKITPQPAPTTEEDDGRNGTTGGCPMGRSSHGVSLVRGGSRLIVYGGEHVARTPISKSNACWAVDHLDKNNDSTSWRQIQSAERSPSDRIAHAQAVHNDKYVYIFGGRAGITMEEHAMNDMWMLDCSGEPGTETWIQIAYDTEKGENPPEARSFHRMICIGDSLYMFGGCGNSHGRLADLWQFDLTQKTWHSLGTSQLRGRGGPNLMSLAGGKKLAAIAGFAGEETKDGHVFDLATKTWADNMLGEELQEMRPRSVCVSGSFPSLGVAVIVGGEVDPSDRGHEGAGGFESDVVLLDETTGTYLGTVPASADTATWPGPRGWADAGALEASHGARGLLYVFGGLAGDDANPKRLDDLWMLEVQKA